MRIFVTGASGFIGQHLVKKLSEKTENEIMILARQEYELGGEMNNVKVLKGNLSSISDWGSDLKEFNPDVTIHMAWEGIPDHGHEVSLENLKNGVKLFLFLRDIGCKKVICPGSCWEYGRKVGCLDEKMSFCPSDSFTAAKSALYEMGRDIFKTGEFKFLWARLFYVYGPGQRNASLIPHIVKSVRKGENPNIKMPDSKNDFVYVGDVVDALSSLVEKGESGIYNIGSGDSVSVRKVIQIIYKLTGKEVGYIGSSEEEVDFWANILKIKREVGWEPKTELERGIKYYLSSLNHKNV